MKERPILFSAPMVRAILAGAKTQTRRALAIQPVGAPTAGRLYRNRAMTKPVFAAIWANPSSPDGSTCCLCPYGVPGDQLWVRETWYCDDYRVQNGPYLKPDDLDVTEAQDYGTLVYRASSGDRPYEAEQPVWRPSIHMPRWASRITLDVLDIRVERLQDISEADAIAEGGTEAMRGWWTHEGLQWNDPGPNHRFGATPIDSYRVLWESINGPGSWGANPWVWAINFKRLA